MIRIRKSIEIHAPLEQVFAYLSAPEHLPEIWPSLVEVKNVVNRPDGWRMEGTQPALHLLH